MGYGSFVVVFVPDDADALRRVLGEIGAVPWPTETGYDEWVLHGHDYWIDLQFGPRSTLGRPGLWIRLAVCNPPRAMEELRRIVEKVLAEAGGVIVVDGNAYGSISEEVWSEVRRSMCQLKTSFFRNFKMFEAPISSRDLFTEIRRRS